MPRNNQTDPELPKTHSDDDGERRDTLPDPRVRLPEDDADDRVDRVERTDEDEDVEDEQVLDIELDDLPQFEGPDA